MRCFTLHLLVQMVALELMTLYNCCPVFLGKELKEQFYKGNYSQQYRLLSYFKLTVLDPLILQHLSEN